MPCDLAYLSPLDQPFLVFGLVAPVGAPLDFINRNLSEVLDDQGYSTKTLRLSDYLQLFDLRTPHPPVSASGFERLSALMNRGNELREAIGRAEALALVAAAQISVLRKDSGPCAFILRQLKHPDEVLALRTIYGSSFQLIGVYCPEAVRRRFLLTQGLSEQEAQKLIDRDWYEDIAHGQQVREAFYRADVFVSLMGSGDEDLHLLEHQLRRYIDLLFGRGIHTPTRDEYGMYLAQAAAFRSADLSRQVGSAILSPQGDLVAVGCNEVPAPGGGQYWAPSIGEKEAPDHRDFARGFDENDRRRAEVLRELLSRLHENWDALQDSDRENILRKAQKALVGTRWRSLTEFQRAVHAEMEALMTATRLGRSVQGCDLYTTTFPCHNCTKHLISAGIRRVVYIEPYPKSLAFELHSDAVRFEAEDDKRVLFEPFTGVAPRMYATVFGMVTPEGAQLRRKSDDGSVNSEPLGLRLEGAPLECAVREVMAAHAFLELAKGVLDNSLRS